MLELGEVYFSLLSTIIVVTMASLFFCCWKRKTCNDAPDGKAKKQEADKARRGSSKKDQPQLPQQSTENGSVSPNQSSPTQVTSGEDLGDFSAVQRETEILRSYRKPPPPKNRGRQSRAPRTALQRSNEKLDIFTELSEEDLRQSDNETLEVNDDVDSSVLRSRPEESPKRDVRSSMLADIEQTLAALHTTEEPKSSGDVRQSKDISSSSEIEQTKDQTNELSSREATESDEVHSSTSSPKSRPSAKPRQAPKVSPKPSPRTRAKVIDTMATTANGEHEDSSGKEGSQSSRLEESLSARLEDSKSAQLEENQSTTTTRLEDSALSTATDEFNTTSASSTESSQFTSLHSDNPITTSETSSTKDFLSGSEGVSEEKSAVSSENVSPLPESSSASSHPAVTELSTVSEEDSKDLSQSSGNLNAKIPDDPVVILPTDAIPLNQDDVSVASDRGDSVSSSVLSASHATPPLSASPIGDIKTEVKVATVEKGNADVITDSITDAESRSTDLASSAHTGSQMTSSLSVVLAKSDEMSEVDTVPTQSIEILKGEKNSPLDKVESKDPSANVDLDEDGNSKSEEHSKERRESTEDQAGKGKHSKIPVRAGSKSRSSPPKATASK